MKFFNLFGQFGPQQDPAIGPDMQLRKTQPQPQPEPQPANLHPRLAQLVAEQWMAPAITSDGRPLIIEGVQYYEFIRNGDKITYSRNLAYEQAVTEYNEIAGHGQLLKYHLQTTKELTRRAFNYRNTDHAESELALQQLIGLNAGTEKALETKHPISFICQVAAIFYVAENEDPDINDATLQEEKYLAFLHAKEYHDFFFRMPIVPLNVFQTLSELNLTLFTAQAYQQLAGTVRPMFLASESDSTANELNRTYKHLLAMSVDTIASYEHLFTRLSNGSTSSELTTKES